jgi:type II secretory ATPase GspE/PulE/Tfp pilus assembly ATPase PilB-like protein
MVSTVAKPLGPNGHAHHATPDPFWLGKRLVTDGVITPEQFSSAVTHYRQEPRDGFVSVICKLGLISSTRAAEMIAEEAKLPLAKINPMLLSPAIVKRLAAGKAKHRVAVPFREVNKQLYVAIADPALYPVRERAIDFGDTPIVLHIAPREDIHAAIDQAWTGTAQVTNPLEFYKELLTIAIAKGASDVHVDHGLEYARIRFRIDGRLVHQAYISGEEGVGIVRAALILTKKDMHEEDMPQSGSFSMEIGAKRYSFRVETSPCYFGLGSVTRIQSDNASILSYNELGISQKIQEGLKAIVDLPNGVILATGPTGSGKSTLLNSILHQFDSTALKICTIEDPVEFPEHNFSQVQTTDERTFEVMLRSQLRQDPDIILVGEIRDTITAQISTRAALTGHLVFATLHTNTAANAITRLIDTGVESFLVASSLRAVISARLIRRVCKSCKIPHPNGATLQARYGLSTDQIFTHKPGGCPECNQTGFKGRVGLFELLPLFKTGESAEALEYNDFIAHTITHESGHEAERKILERVRADGFISLRSDGLRKVEEGITTIEEVLSES